MSGFFTLTPLTDAIFYLTDFLWVWDRLGYWEFNEKDGQDQSVKLRRSKQTHICQAMSIHLNTLMLLLMAVIVISIEARSMSSTEDQGSKLNSKITPGPISNGTEVPYRGPYYTLIETSPICKMGFKLQGNRCRKPA